MKFINYVKYRDLDKIANARSAHFAYADRLRERGKLAIDVPLTVNSQSAGKDTKVLPIPSSDCLGCELLL